MIKHKIGLYGGKFFPIHKGHVDIIKKALKTVDILYIVMWYDETQNEDFVRKNLEDVPYKSILENKTKYFTDIKYRVKQISNIFQFEINTNKIRLFVHDERKYNDNKNWIERSEDIRKEIGCYPDIVFCTDNDAEWKKGYPKSDIINFYDDRENANFKISATKIRSNYLKYFEYIPEQNRRYYSVRCLMTGIESTGKSTLVENLAKKFDTYYVEETGKDVWKRNNGIMTDDEYDEILITHLDNINLELKYIDKMFCFIDTDAVTTLFYRWLYDEYNKGKYTIDYISQNLNNEINDFLKQYDKHNLMQSINHNMEFDLMIQLQPNSEFIQDGTRSYPVFDDRLKIHNILFSLYNYFDMNNIKTIYGTEEKFEKRTIEVTEKIEKLFNGVKIYGK